jgi:hypothetical protein
VLVLNKFLLTNKVKREAGWFDSRKNQPFKDKAEATARGGMGRNDSRRSSLDSGPLKRKKAVASGFTSLNDLQTPPIKPRAEGTSSNRTLPGWSDPDSTRAGDEEGDSSATVLSSKTLASGDGRLSTTKQSVSPSDDHRRSKRLQRVIIERKRIPSQSCADLKTANTIL